MCWSPERWVRGPSFLGLAPDSPGLAEGKGTVGNTEVRLGRAPQLRVPAHYPVPRLLMLGGKGKDSKFGALEINTAL